MKRSILIGSLLIVIAMLILIGASYAYFVANATSVEQTTQSGVLKLTYLTEKNILLENAFPGEEVDAGIHQFAIENTGTLDAMYYLYLDNIVLQKDGIDIQCSNLKWKLYRADENYTELNEIINGDFSTGNSAIELDSGIITHPGEKQYYILKIWLQETGQLQNEDQGLEFRGQVIATTEKKAVNKSLFALMEQEAVLDNIHSTYVASATGIDFSKISSDTNGKGLYILHGTENDNNPIMYYRGAVENNNVRFANFCWKIVRTTEEGGIKLIYNGLFDRNSGCSNMGTNVFIQNDQVFNENFSDNAHVGYMYGNAQSYSYGDTHANVHNSSIKTIIDDWYSKNILNKVDDYIVDTVYCTDRSVVLENGYSGTGMVTERTMYGPRYRLAVNKTPTLECVNENDRLTLNNTLTYPIALLTADEISLAGGVVSLTNTDYYLYNGSYWWSLSPNYFDGSRAGVYGVNENGAIDGSAVNNLGGVRVAISLKSNVKVGNTGDGTMSNPYIVVGVE